MPDKNTSYLASQIYLLDTVGRNRGGPYRLKRFALIYDPEETIADSGNLICSYIEENGIATLPWQVPVEDGFIDIAFYFPVPFDDMPNHKLVADFNAERKRAIDMALGEVEKEFGQLRF